MLADDRVKAIKHEYPEYIPARVCFLPSTWIKYRESLDNLVKRYPELFGSDNSEKNYDYVTGNYIVGEHIDMWGCVWSNVQRGQDSIVTGHPVKTREDIRKMQIPTEHPGLLPHGFMFLKITDLRGYEEAMVDFAEEPEELQILIDKILEYNMLEIELMIKDYNDPIIYFGDDLGMQKSLPIRPETWRKYLKPCFTKMYQKCKEKVPYVYMHTDGCIHEIIPDLKESGVDVVNPQIRANGLDNLVKVCKGKICVDLDLDRQMFPFCTPKDIDNHVREVVEALGDPSGGLWLTAECAFDVPLENIEALCDAMLKYREYFK